MVAEVETRALVHLVHDEVGLRELPEPCPFSTQIGPAPPALRPRIAAFTSAVSASRPAGYSGAPYRSYEGVRTPEIPSIS